MGRALIAAALVLAAVAPLSVVALRRTQQRGPALRRLGLCALLFLCSEIALMSAPRIGGRWNWGGKIAELAVLLVFLAVLRARRVASLREVGVDPRLAADSARPAILAIALAQLLPILGFVAGWREDTSLETFLFQPTFPALNEELEFRGVMQGLLDGAFGTPRRVLGAWLGWGAVLSQLTWALAHAVAVDRALHVSLHLDQALPPLVGGWVLAWLRARTGSAWPCVAAHALGNELIVIGSAIG